MCVWKCCSRIKSNGLVRVFGIEKLPAGIASNNSCCRTRTPHQFCSPLSLQRFVVQIHVRAPFSWMVGRAVMPRSRKPSEPPGCAGAIPAPSSNSYLHFAFWQFGQPVQVLNSAFCILTAPVPQQLQGEFRKLVFVGASPTRGPRSINE